MSTCPKVKKIEKHCYSKKEKYRRKNVNQIQKEEKYRRERMKEPKPKKNINCQIKLILRDY